MKSILIFLSILLLVHAKFTSLAKLQILDVHNSFRNAVAHGIYWVNETHSLTAANMIELKWSSNLEEAAQEYTDSCEVPIEKDFNFYNTTMKNKYLQPVDPDDDLSGEMASTHWALEIEHHEWPTNVFSQDIIDRGMASASRMMWANNRAIGCSFNRCKVHPTSSETTVHVVCLYDGDVNVIGVEIYALGEMCSACPSGMHCKPDSANTALCTV